MSSDLCIHHHLKPTAVQHDNLVDLARHLITRSELLRRWNRLVFSAVESERAPLQAGDVVEGRKMPSMMPLAFGPLAGVPARAHETWSQYGERAFCMPYGSRLEGWVQGQNWHFTDATPIGAGLRIAYALDYGVPSNWLDISKGRDSSSYPVNGFIWERINLDGWRIEEGKDEWALESAQLMPVTLGRLYQRG